MILIQFITDAGDETQMYCTYARLSETVKVGGTILCADALLGFTVKEIRGNVLIFMRLKIHIGKDVICTVNNDGVMGSTKNMNLPGCKIDLPALTEKVFFFLGI
jgi:pyruvate kinase